MRSCTRPLDEREQPPYFDVDLPFGEVPGLDRRSDDIRTQPSTGARHLQIESAAGGGRTVRPEPVGHDETIESPLAPQDVVEHRVL